ncbi:MAG: hypothetical protein LBJ03_00940 [Holosporales bacterium]|nr:hypothetical protein [Holosporales bacterium]
MKIFLINKIRVVLIATALSVTSFGHTSIARRPILKELNVCYLVTVSCLDDVLTSLTSLASNTPPSMFVKVHLGTITEQPGDEEKFVAFVRQFPAKANSCFILDRVDVSAEAAKAKSYVSRLDSKWHWSIFTKLLIADNPALKDLPHLCLVDSDTIFVGNIQPVYEMSIRLGEHPWASTNVKATDPNRILQLIICGSKSESGELPFTADELAGMSKGGGVPRSFNETMIENLCKHLHSFEAGQVSQLMDNGSQWILDSGIFILNIPHIVTNRICRSLQDCLRSIIAHNEDFTMLTDESVFSAHSTQTRKGIIVPFRFNVNIDQTRDLALRYVADLARAVREDGQGVDWAYLRGFKERLTAHVRESADRPNLLTFMATSLISKIETMDPSFVALLPSVADVNKYIREESDTTPIVYHMQGSDAKFGRFLLDDPRIDCGYGWTWAAYRILAGQLTYKDVLTNCGENMTSYVMQYLNARWQFYERYKIWERLPKCLVDVSKRVKSEMPSATSLLRAVPSADAANKQPPKSANARGGKKPFQRGRRPG